MLTICSGVSRAADARSLIAAGAGELFCGVYPEHKGKLGYDINRRNLNAGLASPAEFGRLLEAAGDTPVRVLLNVPYRDEQMEEILTLAERVASEGAAGFVVQEIGLALALRERFPRLALHASSMFDAATVEAVRLLQTIGFSRIILPRQVSLRHMANLAVTGPELEALFFRERCFYDDGHCNFEHRAAKMSETIIGLVASSPAVAIQNRLTPKMLFTGHRLLYEMRQPGLGCRMKLHSTSTDSSNPIHPSLRHRPFWACGLCSLPLFAMGGVRYLKIMNRTLAPALQIACVQFVREHVELYERLGASEEFVSRCRRDFSRMLSLGSCEDYCYYDERT